MQATNSPAYAINVSVTPDLATCSKTNVNPRGDKNLMFLLEHADRRSQNMPQPCKKWIEWVCLYQQTRTLVMVGNGGIVGGSTRHEFRRCQWYIVAYRLKSGK